MITFNEMKVQEIMEDNGLSRDEKVARLREIESEARALQRADDPDAEIAGGTRHGNGQAARRHGPGSTASVSAGGRPLVRGS